MEPGETPSTTRFQTIYNVLKIAKYYKTVAVRLRLIFLIYLCSILYMLQCAFRGRRVVHMELRDLGGPVFSVRWNWHKQRQASD